MLYYMQLFTYIYVYEYTLSKEKERKIERERGRESMQNKDIPFFRSLQRDIHAK